MTTSTMMFAKSSRSWIFALLYLLLAGAGAYFVAGHTTIYRQERLTYAQENDFKKRLLDMDE